MKKKFLLTATLVATMTLAAPMVASAAEAGDGAWQSNAKGWWWQYSNGSYVTNDFVEVNGNTYYFKADGYMATGWQEIKSQYGDWTDWYYFENSGAMVKDSWKQINGKWYWFNASGQMASYGTYTVGDKQQVFAPSGQWVSGWTWDSNTTKYGTSYGWYYANSDGTPYDYDTTDGQLGGWLQSGSYWYYIESNGLLVTDASRTINGTTYYFNDRGQMVTGWYQYGNTVSDWVYCNADGSVYDGWLAYNGSWYYINNGYMKSSDWEYTTAENSDVRYYLGKDGRMVTGWYDNSYETGTSKGTSYIYTNADGSSYTGWVADAGKWYFINNGRMVANDIVNPVSTRNYKKADGTTDWDAFYAARNASPSYILDKNGVMVTNGWYQITSTQAGYTSSNVWCYANADGTGYDGWLQYNGSWYYIKDGVMLINQYTPDGYFVGMDGVWR